MAGLIGLTSHDIDVQDALGAVRWAYEGEWVPYPSSVGEPIIDRGDGALPDLGGSGSRQMTL